MTEKNNRLQFLLRTLKDMDQEYKVFFNPRKQSLEQAGWLETEEEYQARQQSWLQDKAQGAGSTEDTNIQK